MVGTVAATQPWCGAGEVYCLLDSTVLNLRKLDLKLSSIVMHDPKTLNVKKPYLLHSIDQNLRHSPSCRVRLSTLDAPVRPYSKDLFSRLTSPLTILQIKESIEYELNAQSIVRLMFGQDWDEVTVLRLQNEIRRCFEVHGIPVTEVERNNWLTLTLDLLRNRLVVNRSDDGSQGCYKSIDGQSNLWIKINSGGLYEVLNNLKLVDVSNLLKQTGQLRAVGDRALGLGDTVRVVWGRDYLTGHYYAVKESFFRFDDRVSSLHLRHHLRARVGVHDGLWSHHHAVEKEVKDRFRNALYHWLNAIRKESLAFDLIPKWNPDALLIKFNPFVRGYGYASLTIPTIMENVIAGMTVKSFIVMDIAPGVSLDDFLNSNAQEIVTRAQTQPVAPRTVFEHPSMQDTLTIVRWIVWSVYLLHSSKISHRDIKTTNFVKITAPTIEGERVPPGFVKLVDYASLTDNDQPRGGGTIEYLPPEWDVQGLGDGFSQDVWAAGIAIMKVLAAFQGSSTHVVHPGGLWKIEDFIRLVTRFELPEQPPAPQNLFDLIAHMLSYKPSRRISAQQAFESPVIQRAFRGVVAFHSR